jgi:serine/threonine protein kinase
MVDSRATATVLGSTLQADAVMDQISLGKLNVHEVLGRGGYGCVRRATLEGIAGVDFAIKLLEPHLFNEDPSARDRFFQEATLLMQLRHPHIVSVLGVGMHADTPYILMERFAGQTLEETMTRGPFPAERVLPFVIRIASALAHAHGKGIVHRDLKPNNLMTAKDDARIIDFGIAKILGPEASKLTRTGNEHWGNSYTAPDAEPPNPFEKHHDVYSLCANWFYLLTKTSPKGARVEQLLVQRDVPLQHREIILRGISERPQRYTDARELELELQSIGGHQPSGSQEGLTPNEVVVLAALLHHDIHGEPVASGNLHSALLPALTPVMQRLALSRLKERKLVLVGDYEEYGSYFRTYQLTDEGMNWATANETSVIAAEERLTTAKAATQSEWVDDIPF